MCSTGCNSDKSRNEKTKSSVQSRPNKHIQQTDLGDGQKMVKNIKKVLKTMEFCFTPDIVFKYWKADLCYILKISENANHG